MSILGRDEGAWGNEDVDEQWKKINWNKKSIKNLLRKARYGHLCNNGLTIVEEPVFL